MKLRLIYCLLVIVGFVYSQNIELVNPPHWFVGMKYNKIEILLKGKDIGKSTFFLKNEVDAKLIETFRFSNPNYIILSVDVSKVTQAKTLTFNYSYIQKKLQEFKFDLKEKKEGIGKKGISSEDFIYLLAVDRFANGNDKNDDMKGSFQKPDRTDMKGRHGGDIEGVLANFDYLKSLGTTATWLMPIEENNQEFQSYHGYGFTSHYEVDKRFGGNAMYRNYVEKSHQNNLKVVKDVVYNHCGDFHFLWKDKISEDWFNPKVTSNYRATVNVDPYQSKQDKNLANNGWFADVLPDFNQKNPRVANYLTQYSLWWIQEYDVDAYRIDTFAYPDQDFMWKMMQEVTNEYPDFTIFSEIWDSQEAIQSWYSKQRAKSQEPGFKSQDIGITDFEFQYAMVDLAKENFGWNTGLLKIYYTLVQDYVYKDANKNVTFLGNHDIERYLGAIKNDVASMKLATTIMLTTRGIPQWFYGDEILMSAGGSDHALLRMDFPGGWKGDKENKFTKEGRTNEENDFVNYLSKLGNFRKNSKAITKGKLTQFVPEENVYVYFKTYNNEKVMVIINRNEAEFTLKLNRFSELLPENSSATNILNDENIRLDKELKLIPKTAYVLQIK